VKQERENDVNPSSLSAELAIISLMGGKMAAKTRDSLFSAKQPSPACITLS
jgi:hypothetical protein